MVLVTGLAIMKPPFPFSPPPHSPELEALPKRSRSRVGFLRVIGKIKYDTVSVLHIVRYSGVPLGPSYEP